MMHPRMISSTTHKATRFAAIVVPAAGLLAGAALWSRAGIAPTSADAAAGRSTAAKDEFVGRPAAASPEDRQVVQKVKAACEADVQTYCAAAAIDPKPMRPCMEGRDPLCWLRSNRHSPVWDPSSATRHLHRHLGGRQIKDFPAPAVPNPPPSEGEVTPRTANVRPVPAHSRKGRGLFSPQTRSQLSKSSCLSPQTGGEEQEYER